jgi:hypothetical protein
MLVDITEAARPFPVPRENPQCWLVYPCGGVARVAFIVDTIKGKDGREEERVRAFGCAPVTPKFPKGSPIGWLPLSVTPIKTNA